MNLFTAGSYFKSFVSLNEFASGCHTSLANYSLSHTKEPEWLSLAVMKNIWIPWKTFKWNFSGISWTYSGLQPGSLEQSADTHGKCSADAFSCRVLQRSVAVLDQSVRTSSRKDGLGKYSALHLPCDHGQNHLSGRAEEGMILQHLVWKHLSEWWWDVWMGLIEGKLCSWLDANHYHGKRGRYLGILAY